MPSQPRANQRQRQQTPRDRIRKMIVGELDVPLLGFWEASEGIVLRHHEPVRDVEIARILVAGLDIVFCHVMSVWRNPSIAVYVIVWHKEGLSSRPPKQSRNLDILHHPLNRLRRTIPSRHQFGRYPSSIDHHDGVRLKKKRREDVESGFASSRSLYPKEFGAKVEVARQFNNAELVIVGVELWE